MKRILFVVVALLLFAVPAFPWSAQGTIPGTVGDNTVTTITIPQGAKGPMWLFVPTIDTATLTFTVSLDGTNYYSLASAVGTLTTATGSGTGAFVLPFPTWTAPAETMAPVKKIKITASAAQTAARTFILFGK